MNNKCPELIREWIDNDVLPNYADGYNTASTIADIVLKEAKERLESEKQDAEFYIVSENEALIDCWLVVGNHKKAVIDYIQAVFDLWEKEGKPE